MWIRKKWIPVKCQQAICTIETLHSCQYNVIVPIGVSRLLVWKTNSYVTLRRSMIQQTGACGTPRAVRCWFGTTTDVTDTRYRQQCPHSVGTGGGAAAAWSWTLYSSILLQYVTIYLFYWQSTCNTIFSKNFTKNLMCSTEETLRVSVLISHHQVLSVFYI
jgi:hypothetical protein